MLRFRNKPKSIPSQQQPKQKQYYTKKEMRAIRAEKKKQAKIMPRRQVVGVRGSVAPRITVTFSPIRWQPYSNPYVVMGRYSPETLKRRPVTDIGPQ